MASAFTHALVGLAIGTAFRRPKDPTRFWVLGAVGAALPDIDAMTTGGRGVAFFAPFVSDRYFLPWRPILVSPISVTRFFTRRGAAIFLNEIAWVWIPSTLFALLMLRVRSRTSFMSGMVARH